VGRGDMEGADELAVGYLTAIEEEDGQLVGTFHIPESDEGDTVLVQATDGRRDGLSVGVMITEYEWIADGTVMKVLKAQLREVSVVTIPAYQNAPILTVNASHQNGEPPVNIDYQQLAAALGPQIAQVIPP